MQSGKEYYKDLSLMYKTVYKLKIKLHDTNENL